MLLAIILLKKQSRLKSADARSPGRFEDPFAVHDQWPAVSDFLMEATSGDGWTWE
jgi:hypothetical protein